MGMAIDIQTAADRICAIAGKIKSPHRPELHGASAACVIEYGLDSMSLKLAEQSSYIAELQLQIADERAKQHAANRPLPELIEHIAYLLPVDVSIEIQGFAHGEADQVTIHSGPLGQRFHARPADVLDTIEAVAFLMEHLPE